MNVIRFYCSHCGRKIKVAEHFVGQEGKCPSCGNAFTVPEPDDEIIPAWASSFTTSSQEPLKSEESPAAIIAASSGAAPPEPSPATSETEGLDELARAAQTAGHEPAISGNKPPRRQLPSLRSHVHFTRRTKIVLAAVILALAIFELGRLANQTRLPGIRTGGAPSYAQVVDQFTFSAHQIVDRLHKEYPGADVTNLPRDVQMMAEADLMNELDRDVRQIAPPPVDVDSSASSSVADPRIAFF